MLATPQKFATFASKVLNWYDKSKSQPELPDLLAAEAMYSFSPEQVDNINTLIAAILNIPMTKPQAS